MKRGRPPLNRRDNPCANCGHFGIGKVKLVRKGVVLCGACESYQRDHGKPRPEWFWGNRTGGRYKYYFHPERTAAVHPDAQPWAVADCFKSKWVPQPPKARKCKCCGKVFTPEVFQRRYCSERCRVIRDLSRFFGDSAESALLLKELHQQLTNPRNHNGKN